MSCSDDPVLGRCGFVIGVHIPTRYQARSRRGPRVMREEWSESERPWWTGSEERREWLTSSTLV